MRINSFMNTLCKCFEIFILCANNNPEMIGIKTMQTLEIVVIECNQDALFSDCKCQYIFVGDTLIVVSGIFSSQYFMP